MDCKNKVNSVLYIAFHYPPVLGSSGVHRTLAFTRYLSEKKVDTRVLTASLTAYDKWSKQQLKFIPDDVEVIRAYGRNTAKSYSFKGKHFGWMALPDNWQSWIVGGFFSGLKSILKKKPDYIISTYPIASAHIIGYLLHKVTKVPWVADLRDPMAQENYPRTAAKMRIFKWIEKKIIKHCKFAMVTAPGAQDFYYQKYPHIDKAFWKLVPNGFDEHIFKNLSPSKQPSTPEDSKPLVLLHSGVIYPSERDPKDLFSAIKALKDNGTICTNTLEVRLRATGNDDYYLKMLKKMTIDDIVKLVPSIPYQDALQEMFEVDGLLLLQADNCNYQIPAKAYEYIRVQKPVLALTSIEGDTGKLFSEQPFAKLAPLDDEKAITTALTEYIECIRNNSFSYLTADRIALYSRRHQAKLLLKGLSEATLNNDST